LFYVVSKIFWFFSAPTNALILLLAVSALWAWRVGSKLARTTSLVAALALFVAAFSPISTWLMMPLENRFPQWQGGPQRPPDGIIVLGGAVDVKISEAQHYPLKLNEAGERILALVELARQFPSARLAFTGTGEPISEAEEVAKKISRLGVDPMRLILETQARNTFENAQFSAKRLAPKPGERWLLITSAWHMPRAVGCFRRAGFVVDAYPVDFRTAGLSDLAMPYYSGSDGLRQMDFALKEWVGLIVYWLTGKTDALLPGPVKSTDISDPGPFSYQLARFHTN
jgi:uncharacterized SAM-binding protein YcdF (DUF218 family)